MDGNFSGDHWARQVSLSNLITHAENCPKLWDGFDLLFVSSESQQKVTHNNEGLLASKKK